MERMSTPDEKLVLKLITHLKKLPGIIDFLQPVDYERLGLIDYREVVQKPMDLGTVRRKVWRHDYASLALCLADIQLIWDNCKAYNMHDSLIVQNALHFEKAVKDFLALNSLDHCGAEDNGLVSFEEQLELSEKVKLADAKTLQEIVKLVTQHCPQAIIGRSGDRMRIRVDAIDGNTYRKLKGMVGKG